MVKTTTQNYSMKEIAQQCTKGCDTFIAAKADFEEEKEKMLAVVWRDKKVHIIIRSCGKTIEGTPAKKCRTDDARTFYEIVLKPSLFKMLFDGMPAIDMHIHIREDGLALDYLWDIHKLEHLIFASLLGIVETRAFFPKKYLSLNNVQQTHITFTSAFAMQMINYEGSSGLMNENSAAEDHILVPLATNNPKNRSQVQQKCVVYSCIC